MMKTYKYILAASLAVSAALSCEKWPDRQVFEGSGLGAVTKYYELPETATETHVDVIATMPYDIRCNAGWLSVPASSQGRDGFKFTCEPNTALTRQATIILAIDKTNHYDTLTISQNGTTAIKAINGDQDGLAKIDLNAQVSSTSLEVNYYNGAKDWISDCEVVSDELSFSYKKNESSLPRFASIVIAYKNAEGKALKHRFDVLQSNSADSLQPSENTFVDLTNEGVWSNCYILPETQATAYGIEVKHVSGELISDKVRTAEILWETAQGTVTDLVYVQGDNRLYFEKPAGVRGNAVVAFKDYNGNVLWSNHLWASGEAVADIEIGDNFFMDRNIGAIANTAPANGESDAAGMYYQWGRKDPFPSTRDMKSNNGLMSAVYPDNAVTLEVAQNGVALEKTISNPSVYYWGNANKGAQDWSSPQNEGYWSSSAKTDYDPCPQGYVVPDLDQITALTKAVSSEKPSYGSYIVDKNGTKNYLSWGGWLRRMLHASTPYAHTGQHPHLWTSTTGEGKESSNNNELYSGAYATNTPTTTLVYPRRWGGNIRCVKVQNNH